jgi:hypothetical protein
MTLAGPTIARRSLLRPDRACGIATRPYPQCRMQQVGSASRFPGGPLQCLREILATEGGVRGLARGLGATLAREVPGNALFFAVYEGLRCRGRGLGDGWGLSVWAGIGLLAAAARRRRARRWNPRRGGVVVWTETHETSGRG